jgi:hypothetical protein
MRVRNVSASRAITHEVVRANMLESDRPPILSNEIFVLDAKGNMLVERRLVDSVSSGSHSVEVIVEDPSTNSPFDKISSLLGLEDTQFIIRTKELADDLSHAQTSGAIKRGSIIFLHGTCDSEGRNLRFIAIVKADSDQAFIKQIDENGVITLDFVNDILLGESQRLIKVAFFLEERRVENIDQLRDPSNFSIVVFDHMLQNRGTANAAAYFYKTFLKCRLAENSSRLTKVFFETTKKFINKINVEQEEKLELHSSLVSYLRNNRTTINPRDYAQDSLPVGFQDEYIRECEESSLDRTISKDLGLIKGRLKRQSIRFDSKVIVTASTENIKDSVQITGTTEDGWTELKIKGRVERLP